MVQELVKIAREVGTSAGVLLPRNLLGAKVKISVLEEAPNPLIDSIKILKSYNLNSSVLGIYLVGSYARKEANLESDVDILVITKGVSKTINEGRYSLTLVSLKDLERSLKENVIYYYPMVFEAKTLINEDLICNYKKKGLSKNVLDGYIKDTKKIIKKIECMIKLDKKLKNKNTNDNVAYSLILRLKGFYILKKILSQKIWSNKEFLKGIDKNLYQRYSEVKRKNKYSNKTPIENAEEGLEILKREVDKWQKERKD